MRKILLLFTIFKRYLLENGVGSDHIVEIALDGIENEELRDPKLSFLISKASRYDIKGGICMKRNYWALLVFALIIVLQWIGLGFHGQTRFIFLIIILVLICFIGNIITEIVKVNSEVIV
mgnify:CR=1 FL=1